MKLVKISLRQDGDRFRIERFTNTVNLSVGQMVPREKLAEWVVTPCVRIEVIGAVEEQMTGVQLTDRADVMELAGGVA